MDFLQNYGLFFAKTITIAAVFFIFIGFIALLRAKNRDQQQGELTIVKINEKYEDMKSALESNWLDKNAYKKLHKEKKKKDKEKAKEQSKDKEQLSEQKRLFVLNFDGDLRASDTDFLREEITAILLVATPKDEVLVRLESGGGMVHCYGLAAAQLARFRDYNIKLTVVVDKVAASGGYMMASVANTIMAAPFAIVGSIGVLAQIPNFNRVLKKYNIDFEQITAGEFKRTLTLFGENTKKDREKFQEEIEDTHQLFKDFITHFRPQVDINTVATGEHWYGQRAIDLNLVDGLMTSDDYLLQRHEQMDIYEVMYEYKMTFKDKLSEYIQGSIKKTFRYFFAKY